MGCEAGDASRESQILIMTVMQGFKKFWVKGRLPTAAQVPQGIVDREIEAQVVHGGKNLPLSFASLASAKHMMVTRLLLNVCCLCAEGWSHQTEYSQCMVSSRYPWLWWSFQQQMVKVREKGRGP